MAEDVYGFDQARAERLKAIADHPKVINSLSLPRRRQPTGGGSAVTYAFPPSTGIPAATYNATTKTLTVGTANCKLAIEGPTAGRYVEGTEVVLVENQIGSAVATNGKPITIAMNSFGRWEIIVEDCTAGSGGGINSSPDNPVPSPDPISEGTSNSLTLGYTLGV